MYICTPNVCFFANFAIKGAKDLCAHFLQLHSKSVLFSLWHEPVFKHIYVCESFYGLRALWYLGLWHPMLVQIIPFLFCFFLCTHLTPRPPLPSPPSRHPS